MNRSNLPFLAMAFVIAMWSSAFVGIRAALESYSPYHLALLRYLIASGIMVTAGIVLKVRLPDKKDIPAILLIGFTGITIYHIALNYGEISIDAGSASFIVNSVPLLTALFAMLFLKERVTVKGWVGLFIGFIGVSLIIIGQGEGLTFSKGAMILMLAAVSLAAFFVMQKPFLKKYKPLEFTTYIIVAGTLFMIFLSPGLVDSVLGARIEDTLSVIYLGIFPGAIGYILFAWVLARFSAARASSFILVSPVLTLLFSWWWLEELPGLLSLIGGGIALGGVFFYQRIGETN